MNRRHHHNRKIMAKAEPNIPESEYRTIERPAGWENREVTHYKQKDIAQDNLDNFYPDHIHPNMTNPSYNYDDKEHNHNNKGWGNYV